MQTPRITIEQWLAFKTVVDEGSYAGAAELLNKGQSSISYSVSKLNKLLPQPVLKLSGRKAVLTQEGKVLYRHAEQILNAASDAESVAKAMSVEFESEVVVAVDVLIQVSTLVPAFEAFSNQFPNTRIKVLETSLSGTTEALLEKQATMVIAVAIPTGFSGIELMEIEMIPVAAAAHPLVFNRSEVSELELRSHRQIVLRDTGTKREQDAGWLSAQQRWTVSHFSTSIALIKKGLAFGFIPKNWIEADLKSGQLKQIPLEQNLARKLTLYLLFSDKNSAGPATKALAELIQTHCRG